MNEILNPDSIGAPAAAYSLGMKVPAGSDLIITSGIVATRADGTIPSDLIEQAESVWYSITEVLGTGGFTLHDLVGYTTYVVESPTLATDLPKVMAVRDRVLAGHLPTSTLIVVPRLARPEWLIEIAAIAARKQETALP
jgi:2-iminobutanoate/2-iminopropanoate deaminase